MFNIVCHALSFNVWPRPPFIRMKNFDPISSGPVFKYLKGVKFLGLKFCGFFLFCKKNFRCVIWYCQKTHGKTLDELVVKSCYVIDMYNEITETSCVVISGWKAYPSLNTPKIQIEDFDLSFGGNKVTRFCQYFCKKAMLEHRLFGSHICLRWLLTLIQISLANLEYAILQRRNRLC